jgi:hypothetical protein
MNSTVERLLVIRPIYIARCAFSEGGYYTHTNVVLGKKTKKNNFSDDKERASERKKSMRGKLLE